MSNAPNIITLLFLLYQRIKKRKAQNGKKCSNKVFGFFPPQSCLTFLTKWLKHFTDYWNFCISRRRRLRRNVHCEGRAGLKWCVCHQDALQITACSCSWFIRNVSVVMFREDASKHKEQDNECMRHSTNRRQLILGFNVLFPDSSYVKGQFLAALCEVSCLENNIRILTHTLVRRS